jgi:hypothetical protein
MYKNYGDINFFEKEMKTARVTFPKNGAIMTDFTKNEIEAMKKALSLIGIDPENMTDEVAHNYLTINAGSDGEEYAWYFDETNNIAVEVGNTDHVVDDDRRIDDLFGTGFGISDSNMNNRSLS